MKKHKPEKTLQNYLTKNNGFNLGKINSSLSLIESEHVFKGGRIDILAETPNELVGIELKAASYCTRNICAQLINYLNYITEKNGILYFIAPKISYGIYNTLKNFYYDGKINFFEFETDKTDYYFKQIIYEKNSNNKSAKPTSTSESQQINYALEANIKNVLEIFLNKKNKTILNLLVDSTKPRDAQIEEVADLLINNYTSKNSILKKAYFLSKYFK